MNKTVLFTIFLVITGLWTRFSLAQCAQQANIYSFSYNGKNYDIVKELQNWSNAAACAVERGGHLVHLETSDENNAIMQEIIAGASIAVNYTIVFDGGGIAYLWTGATDKSAEGTWLWDGDDNNSGLNFWTGQGTAGTGNGTPIGGAYNNWGTSSFGSEPDDFLNNQDGAGIALSSWPYGSAGQWNDIALSNQLYYVIEYEPAGIDEETGSLQVFPNPATTTIFIQGLNSSVTISGICISAMDGRIVRTEILPDPLQGGIDISGLAPGCYVMSITLGNSVKCLRFIK
ncbi:MAG: T9SS type A sorting domain-containing protein [Bacteroidales bacterium]